MIRAVLWDFGGVLTTSPFDAFARYERERGLPPGILRRINATNPDSNAWACLERAEIGVDEFASRFRAEALEMGVDVDGGDVLGLLGGDLRPEVVAALRACAAAGLRNGLLTNNVVALDDPPPDVAAVLAVFDVVLESFRLGLRKPDPRIYLLACDRLGVEPRDVAYLDDLGVNLKPARQLGMTTIKVDEPRDALAALERALGTTLRGEGITGDRSG